MNELEQSKPVDVLDEFQKAQTKNEIAEVLKELFDKGKIYMISDLSKDEIRLLTRIYMIAEMKDIDIWKQGIVYYCTLMISKNRKSRMELIEAIRGYQSPQSMMAKINPFNWGSQRR